MSKYCIIFFLIFSFALKAQVSVSSWINSYMQVNNYNGNTNPDAYTVTFAGNGNFNVPHWRLSAKLQQNIVSENGQYTIPGNKVSFQPVSTTGQGNPGPTPSMAQIGVPSNVFLQENVEAFLVPQSNAPLYNMPSSPNGYYSLSLKFAVTLMGGAYLGTYPAWTRFNATVEFTAYDQNNNVIGRIPHTFQFHIGALSGTPPTTQEMSLIINPNVANGVLEFDSMQDYNDGNSITYSNGLKVNTNTNFQIKVRSLQNHLSSPLGYAIPISAIHLRLQPLSQGTQTIYPLTLSSTSQILAKGNASQNTTFNYDLVYYSLAQDQQLINAKPGEYSTTLQYEITPQ
ncbi:hypothetical protein [Chryseobacterium luquanense]|uniref:Uncharacterized protein n=1 Tax=Chryseobacterium luquanense TaxID=2983766 RepID=A0ABT3Y7E8_9FLAO|nr:hypothetical protein [Chryseobacterium luquanense]MCX8534084.1 hypothetical protein [Chryseobacterium luquanense]